MCLSGHRKYPLGSSDPAVCTRSIEIMEKAVRLAADLGVRIIQLAGYDVYYEDSTPDTAARFLENLSFAAMLAAPKRRSARIRDNGNAFYEYSGESDALCQAG